VRCSILVARGRPPLLAAIVAAAAAKLDDAERFWGASVRRPSGSRNDGEANDDVIFVSDHKNQPSSSCRARTRSSPVVNRRKMSKNFRTRLRVWSPVVACGRPWSYWWLDTSRQRPSSQGSKV